jgi:hypothetical protein
MSEVNFSDEPQIETPINETPEEEEKLWLSRIDTTESESIDKSSEVPDWLSELEQITPQIEPAVSDLQPEIVLPIQDETTPSPIVTEQISGDLDTIPNDTFTPWLSDTPSEGEVEGTPKSEKEGASGITPAELPGWLQAMRPIEATVTDTELGSGGELEKAEVAGPLAGLRGVLPAEPEISQVQKPSSYSIKLQATEVQQSQASLLEGMIRSEGETQSVAIHPVITSQHVFRIVIAIILILCVLVPMATGIPQVGMPVDVSGIPPSVQLVNSLSAGSPVILAVDYTPGFSGEMDAIFGSVVDHLMRQGVYLTIVSTSPTGPAQAERLITSLNQKGNHGYASPDQYINLGLIPGGATGLLRFSGAPNLVLTRDILGKPAWNIQPLYGINALSGFSMVIVATENPENARSWIEQVQPGLKGTPLILVVSAQAEPLIRPYFEAIPQQIQGLISGLAGGVSYQSQISKNGQSSVYWPSYSIGMMFAGILIVIGGLINLGFAYVDRRKESDRNLG